MLGCAGPPVLTQRDEVDVLLSFTRLHRRDLSGVEAATALPGELLHDLRSPCRELADHPARHMTELGHPFPRVLPLDAERAGQLGPEVRLVEVAGCEAVRAQDRLAVKLSPLVFDPRLGHVRDDHVRVQVRVLRTARAVLVGGGDEADGVLAAPPLGSTPDHACFVLEIGERRLPRARVRLIDGSARLLVTERMQEADALRDAEHEVEAGDGRELLHVDEALVGEWIDALDRYAP